MASLPPLALRGLSASDRRETERFLLRSPVENLFLLGVIEEHGMLPGFLGAFDGTSLRALLFVAGGRSGVPFVPEPGSYGGWAAMAAAIRPGGRIVGARDAVEPLWQALRARLGGVKPVLDRPQMLYSLEVGTLRKRVQSELRTATYRDLDAVVVAHAGMVQEDEGYDPQAVAPDRFRRSILARIERGRVFIAEEGGHALFKVDLSARSRYGAQFAGVWTAPRHRRRGIASRCLADLAGRLIGDCPRVTLHVNRENAPAIRTYETVGFRPAMDFRMVVLGY